MAALNPELQRVLAELRDINKDRRRTAVMKLGMMGGEEATMALIRAVDDEHEDLIVRGRAALMLGKMGDSRAVPPLIRALDAPGFQTPLNAIQSLGQLGDMRAVDPLRAIAENSRDRRRDAARVALKQLGKKEDEETSPETEADLQSN